MTSIGSFAFVEYVDKQEHQNLVDHFFLNQSDNPAIAQLFEIKSTIGERNIGIFGNNEKDYHFYVDDFLLGKDIKELSKMVIDKKIDNLKIPLLSIEGAQTIISLLKNNIEQFTFHINLSSISPIIDKSKFSKNRKSYARSVNKFINNGFTFAKVEFVNEEIKKFHINRWDNNRSDLFFNFLKYLNKQSLSESYGLFKEEQLVAYIQLIVTGNTIHYYYSIFDEDYEGAGGAIICFAINVFLERPDLKFFSFGRGAENYKYRWATGAIKNYEVRGFLTSHIKPI
jgi:hypothetical protein